MSEVHQTLRFGDLPNGTLFQHPKTNEVYKKTFETSFSNAVAEGWQTVPVRILVHPNAIVTLTSSIDFFSLNYSAKFTYEQKVYTKISRNRARHGDITKHFEPSDSVSPL